MTPPVATVAQLAQLEAWVRHGWLREIDAALAAFLAREAPDAHPLLLLGAALASHQLGRGHAFLDLRAVLADAGETLALPPEEGDAPAADLPLGPAQVLAGIRLEDWRAALDHASLVGFGDSAGAGATPLVLAGDRLYLRRYWRYERTVDEAIAERLASPASLGTGGEARLHAVLSALFPPADDLFAPLDWQKVACALAARSRFAIVTGGPGTGKTTTVVRLLAVLQDLAMATGPKLRIRLAAPTGKAAARLNESIASAVANLLLARDAHGERVRAAIPTEVTTVHRLLGSRMDTRRFHHHARNPLPLDVLVLDEASMVDLEMMANVLEALPAHARLVLLGDKDQLASVEAGAVLGALCRRADGGHYTQATTDWLRAVTGEDVPGDMRDPRGQPLDQAVVKLRKSHRFTEGSGIRRLADAVNAGDAGALAALRADPPADLAFAELPMDGEALRQLVLEGAVDAVGAVPAARAGRPRRDAPLGFRHYLGVLRRRKPPAAADAAAMDGWARDVLDAFGAFRLLCAVRRGPAGVETLNAQVAAWLQAEGLVPADQGWYLGRPVMVIRNDYGLGLMNGDVGVTLAQPPAGGGRGDWTLRVAFARGDGGIRWVLPSRLQGVETAFAMTVHKSQGSEFAHAALLLPDRMNRVLTRELVYTAVTRASARLTVAGHLGLLEPAIARRLARTGGLLDAES
ncbi:exodeoxyribonuclease V subunit alpha [Caenimonas sedimenti]|uniref:RecBCD enzyme subunit RecD n=1 Tax=Caenimonas sedimenti TaxID=2596921 RepID=A0A562ZJU4_9BURK|nr:exodeoxyribonuclease V subunit alpha [Caenimonas sedimenti]TWO68657.1 exodeoxyribonuclease V subunit alpha [Caenimonas sedimenti]